MNTSKKNSDAESAGDAFERLKSHIQIGVLAFAFLALFAILGSVGMESAAELNERIRVNKQAEISSKKSADNNAASETKANELILLGFGGYGR